MDAELPEGPGPKSTEISRTIPSGCCGCYVGCEVVNTLVSSVTGHLPPLSCEMKLFEQGSPCFREVVLKAVN